MWQVRVGFKFPGGNFTYIYTQIRLEQNFYLVYKKKKKKHLHQYVYNKKMYEEQGLKFNSLEESFTQMYTQIRLKNIFYLVSTNKKQHLIYIFKTQNHLHQSSFKSFTKKYFLHSIVMEMIIQQRIILVLHKISQFLHNYFVC